MKINGRNVETVLVTKYQYGCFGEKVSENEYIYFSDIPGSPYWYTPYRVVNKNPKVGDVVAVPAKTWNEVEDVAHWAAVETNEKLNLKRFCVSVVGNSTKDPENGYAVWDSEEQEYVKYTGSLKRGALQKATATAQWLETNHR